MPALRWMRLYFSLTAIISLPACAPSFQVRQPLILAHSNSMAVVPIHVNPIQKEYADLYFETFHKEFTARFAAHRRIISLEEIRSRLTQTAYADDADCTWLEAVAIGKFLNVDAVAGVLFDDSDRPGYLIEIVKIVRPANEKILAVNTFSFKPKTNYRFKNELKALEKAWKP
ncbi:MAG: hypothetical protein HY547_00065 [Elusimicrobia bacterium]|nr:hypothetical protein [Elusimicrobiota bacterium]